jgi:gliding motility-associated-like protein
VNPTPVMTSSLNPAAICSGTPFNYTATSGTPSAAYSWTRISDARLVVPTSSGSVASIFETLTLTNSTLAPVVVNYAYSLTANGCTSAPYTVSVTVNPTPQTPVITPAGPVSICSGTTVLLSAPAGYTYQWSTGATTQSISVSTAGTFTVVVKDATGCQSLPGSVTTVIAPAATAYAGPDATICAGNDYTISGASVSNNFDFVWSTSGTGTFDNSGSLSAKYNPSAADIAFGSVNLTLSASNKAPCLGSVLDVMKLTIQPAPTASAGPNQTACYPASILISGATMANGQNPTWNLSGAGTLTNTNSLTPTYQPASGAGVYTVTLTLTVNAIAPCSAPVTSTKTIQVSSLPGNPGVITPLPGLAYVCVGSSEQYSILPFADPTTVYNWSLPPGATITAGAGSNNITASYGPGSSTGNVTVFGSNSCGNGVVSTLPRTVNNIPVIPGSILGNPNVCQSTSGIVYSIAPVPGATGYSWSVPSGAGIVLGAGTNSITVDYGASSVSGNVSVYAINACGNGPTSSKAITVNVKPTKPVISASGNPTTFCEGGTVLLSGAPAGYTYLWTPGGATTQNNVVSASGNYTVVVTNPATGCSSIPSNLIAVTVNPAPVRPSSVGFITVCWNGTGAAPTLDAAGNPGIVTPPAGSTIVWYDAAVNGNMVVNPSITAILGTTVTQTFYAESLESVHNCTSLTRTPVTFTIGTNPAVPVKGPDIIQCEQTPIQTLTATATAAPGSTLSWFTTATGGTPVSPTWSAVGNQTFYAEATNGTCPSLTRSAGVKLQINPAPAPPISGGNITQCVEIIPHPLTVTATVPAGYTLSWWSLPVGGVGIVPTLSTGTVASKTFYAESTNNLTGCKSLVRTPITIDVVSIPAPPSVNPAGVTTFTSSAVGAISACEATVILPLDANNAVFPAPVGSTIKWYNSAGSLVANPTLSTVGSVVYYGETFNGSCTSTSPRTQVTLTINPAPTAPNSFGTATKCAEAVIVPLTATAVAAGSTIVWYTSPSGGTPIIGTPTLSNVGTVTYYAEAINPSTGCASLGRSAPVVLTINATPAQPTTLNADDNICQKTTPTTLTATAIATGGANVVWYNAASGGSVVSPATLSIPGTVTYWAEAVLGTCKSPSPRTTSVKLTINPSPAPPVFSETEKKKCYDGLSMSVPVVANVDWFETSTGGDALSTIPTLTDPESKTFYAEAVNSITLCRSLTRTAYKLTILTTPAAPISGGNQRVCAGATIPTLTASATSSDPIKWYRTSTGGAPVSSPTWNSIGTISYWAESDNGTCVSTNTTLAITRTEVKLTIDPAPVAPTSLGPKTFCANDPILVNGDFNSRITPPPGNYIVEWFNGASDPNPLDHTPKFTELSPGTTTFYAGFKEQTTGCQSQVRTAVAVTINALPLAPISKGDVIACALKPVQVIKAEVETPADGAKITWYTSSSGGSVVASPTLNKIATITYYAQSELNNCINPIRTKVVLTINPVAADPVLLTAKLDSIVDCENLPIVGRDAKTLFNAITGTTYVGFDASVDGIEVPTVLDYTGTKVIYMAAKNAFGCLSARRIPVKMVIHPAPLAPVSNGDLTNCAKDTAQVLDANTAIVPDARYKLLWYDTKTGGSLLTKAPILKLGLGKLKDTITYYASYKDTITGCETIAKRTSVLLTLNTATASAASNSPLALGQTLLLKGGPEVAGNTFLWTDPHGFGFSTMDVTIPNVTEFAAGMYKLTVTSANGCIATDSVLVELDIAHAEAQMPVCLGGTLYLSGYPAGMKAYAWAGPNGWTSSDQNPSINNVVIANTGTYKLTVTNFNNATSSDTVSVAFKALPIPIAQAVAICPAGTMQLKANPGGMTSYLWSGPGGFTSALQNPAPMAYPDPPAEFKLTVVDWNGCEASTTITPKVFQPTITSNSPICSGDTLRLRGEPNGMVSYKWSGPNNFNSTLQSPSLNNVTAATATGKYTLTVVDKGGCTYSNSIDVSFNAAPPAATITPNMNPICEGSTLILNGGPAGMTSYNWTGPNGFTYMGQDPQIPAMTAANAGKYTLKIVTPLGCKSSFETVINVSSVNFNGTYGPYCIGDSPVTMSVNPAGGTFTGPGISGTTFDPKVAGVGSHAIQYTYSPAGVACQIVATKMIDVVSVPKVAITNPILKSCSGTTADLTLPAVTVGSTPGLMLTYWTDAKASIMMATPKAASAGLYFIKGATPSGKCFDIQPVMVTQPDSLRATLTQISALSCAGDTTGRLAVKVTMGTAPYTYLWSTIPAQVKDTAVNLRSGIYTVVVTDAKSCTTAFTGEIKEPAPIKLSFATKAIQCLSDANGSARVDSINGSGDVSILNSYKYLWNTIPPQTTREAVRLTAWWHKVTLTSPKGCVQKDSVFIDVLDTVAPTIVCPKDIELTVAYITSTNGSPNKYKVDLGKPYTTDNCQVDTLTNDAPALFRKGTTIVVWTVTDQVGLTDTCHQVVFIKELPTIPQLISPNGDGVNDTFIIDGLNSLEYQGSQMSIFTRSGQLVFQSSNYELPENAWDGRYKESGFSKNSLVAPGVYYYILKLGGNGGQTLKGYVYVYY